MVGYLPQDGLTHSGRTVFEEAESAFEGLLGIKAEMHDLEHRLGDPSVPHDEHEAMLSRYAELQDRFRLADGYTIDTAPATSAMRPRNWLSAISSEQSACASI